MILFSTSTCINCLFLSIVTISLFLTSHNYLWNELIWIDESKQTYKSHVIRQGRTFKIRNYSQTMHYCPLCIMQCSAVQWRAVQYTAGVRPPCLCQMPTFHIPCMEYCNNGIVIFQQFFKASQSLKWLGINSTLNLKFSSTTYKLE